MRNAIRQARKRQSVADGAKVTFTADDLAWCEKDLRQERSEHEAVGEQLKRTGNAASG